MASVFVIMDFTCVDTFRFLQNKNMPKAKKLCGYNFERGKTTNGHCKNRRCKFLHPDVPTHYNDSLWCPDDSKRNGGCLNWFCPLYHPLSCAKKDIPKFKANKCDDTESITKELTTKEIRKRRLERSESKEDNRKRRILSTSLKHGVKYRVKELKEFDKKDIDNNHSDKLNTQTNDSITFVSPCDERLHNELCGFVKVKNKFGQHGFMPLNSICDEEIPFYCPFGPECKTMIFESEPEYLDHLCRTHFHQDLKLHLEISNSCPLCNEDIEDIEERIFHFGSTPHQKVLTLLYDGVDNAIDNFREQNEAKFKEKEVKFSLAYKEKIKYTENLMLKKDDEMKEMKRNLKIVEDERNALDSERDTLDEEKVDFLTEINELLTDGSQIKFDNLASVMKRVRCILNEKNSNHERIKSLEQEIQDLQNERSLQRKENEMLKRKVETIYHEMTKHQEMFQEKDNVIKKKDEIIREMLPSITKYLPVTNQCNDI